jgi:hypothetical protein
VGPDELFGRGPAFVAQVMGEMPIPAIRAKYGVSRFAINQYCREYQIYTPPKGYWQSHGTAKRSSRSSRPAVAAQVQAPTSISVTASAAAPMSETKEDEKPIVVSEGIPDAVWNAAVER